ncbi:MAG: hypothetical protein M4579_001912 [Chaenotheca gracillima]|nr:MAG: hypothetical protein M4579_001912 [Chaenotheca gracillima]
MFRNLRTIFSVSRLPLRIQARIARDPYASVHNVQRVRFVQPMLSRRRLLNTVLYGTAFVYGVVVFPAVALALLDDGEEEKDNKKDAEPSFINEEDDSIFIPLGLIHEAPSKPYKGTDPEWKEFVKFNREKESHKRLWGDLKQLTGKLVAGSYPLNQALGGSEVRVTQSWLNIEYPYRPPPEYERSGLEISDSHVAWTRRTIPPASYARLRKIMFPQPVSYSFLAALQVVWSSQVQTMKRRWGYENQLWRRSGLASKDRVQGNFKKE